MGCVLLKIKSFVVALFLGIVVFGMLPQSAMATLSNAQFFDRLTRSAVGNAQWEVLNGNATIELNLSINNASIVGFAFNTNPVDFPCVCSSGVPPAGDTGIVINDSTIVVSVPAFPTATVRFDGVDAYDWDMSGFDTTSLIVSITGLPLTATNDEIAVGNNLIETVLGFSGEFAIAVEYDNDNVVWAYTTIGLRGDPSITSRFLVPEPGTFALFGIGLVGLAGMRRRRKVA